MKYLIALLFVVNNAYASDVVVGYVSSVYTRDLIRCGTVKLVTVGEQDFVVEKMEDMYKLYFAKKEHKTVEISTKTVYRSFMCVLPSKTVSEVKVFESKEIKFQFEQK